MLAFVDAVPQHWLPSFVVIIAASCRDVGIVSVAGNGLRWMAIRICDQVSGYHDHGQIMLVMTVIKEAHHVASCRWQCEW